MIDRRKIAVVDDDDALRDSLSLLLRFRGFDVSEFSSGQAFIGCQHKHEFVCILLDVRMPDIDGLSVLRACKRDGVDAPVIMVTAFADVSSAKATLKEGAFDYLEKPVDEADMMKVINEAVAKYDNKSAETTERRELEERLSRLSNREAQLLQFVVDGLHNREIASLLEISVRTVEVYKSRMMEKMRVNRLPDLIRLMTRHGVSVSSIPHSGNK